MNIKIAVIQASLITSSVVAQELEWIRRYPDRQVWRPAVLMVHPPYR